MSDVCTMKDLSPVWQQKLELLWPMFTHKDKRIDVDGMAEAFRREGAHANKVCRRAIDTANPNCSRILTLLELEGVLCVSLKERGWETAFKNLQKKYSKSSYILDEHIILFFPWERHLSLLDAISPSAKEKAEQKQDEARAILNRYNLDQKSQKVFQHHPISRL